MLTQETITSRYLYPKGSPQKRFFALSFFGALILIWNVAGHTFLGFEQSVATPVVAVLVAALMIWVLEYLRSWSQGDTPRYIGSASAFASTFLPALIPGLAVGMLLYPNENLAPIAFAAALAIASKVLVRVPFGNGSQHVFNPSNFGITLTLLAYPSVGLAPPYHFTENLTGVALWILPAGILISGFCIHALYTGRLALCIAWLTGFVVQGLVRAFIFDIPWIVPLTPMTSAAFILFTLYMIPDPATTPLDKRRQVIFGLSVASVYGCLISMHVVFGLFIALFLVCLVRGCLLTLTEKQKKAT